MVPQCPILLITWVFRTGNKLSEVTILPKMGSRFSISKASCPWAQSLRPRNNNTAMSKTLFTYQLLTQSPFDYYFLKTLIPIRSKFPNQRSFEELPQRNAFFFAFALGRDADTPFVIKDMGETIFFNQTDRIEVAGNRFPKVTLTF